MAAFKSAFAAARKAGKKTFDWNGKSYTTELASSKKSSSAAPKTSAKPKARPTSTASAPKNTGTAGRASRRTTGAKKNQQGPTKSGLGLVQRMKNRPKKASTGTAGRKERRDR